MAVSSIYTIPVFQLPCHSMLPITFILFVLYNNLFVFCFPKLFSYSICEKIVAPPSRIQPILGKKFLRFIKLHLHYDVYTTC
jgi:hypothetical protein